MWLKTSYTNWYMTWKQEEEIGKGYLHSLSPKCTCIELGSILLGTSTPNTNSTSVVVIQLLCHVWLFVTPWTLGTPGYRPSLCPGVCSHSHLLSQWCYLVTPFSSCPQSFPTSGSFPMSQLFASGGQSTGALASVLPMNIQGWFPLKLTG